jgi:hypothetical protein
MDLGAGSIEAYRQGTSDEAQASCHQDGATLESVSITARGTFQKFTQ